jgi:hypothetical protein
MVILGRRTKDDPRSSASAEGTTSEGGKLISEQVPAPETQW